MSQDFTTTCWTVILDASKTSIQESRPALESMCAKYWEPLYAYARRSGKSHQDAQDSTQAFFEHLLEKNLPKRASPELGRFRCFLLTALRNFMHSEHRDATALKRGGKTAIHVSLEEEPCLADEISTAESPEAAYDRKWAHTLLNMALDRLAEQQRGLGSADRFAIMRPLLLDPERTAEVHAQLSARFNLTDGGIRTAMSRLRANFRDIVRQEVARIVDDPAEIDDEIAHLLKALR